MNLFRRFQDVGVTVLIATHDMALVREFAQREILIDEGRVFSATPPDPGSGAGPSLGKGVAA
jgi:cell division transport system ATP-binding protein